jgi:hypothetical protein
MYKDILKALREQVFSADEVEAPAKRSGIIQARVDSKPLEEARVSPYSDWLRSISSVAQELKTQNTEGEGSMGGFLKGFTQTADILQPKEKKYDGLDTVPEENRDALIRRRGDRPSFYAPDNGPVEKNSHEARINSTGDSGFIALIDKHEGGGDYDTLYTHAQKDGRAFEGVKVSQMTIGELKQFAKGEYGRWSKGKLGYVATPMGRYQFVGSTMGEVARQMGLPDDTVFSPETQDAMFNFWVDKTIAKGDTVDEKVALLRGQWEGFKHVKTSTLADLVVKYGA